MDNLNSSQTKRQGFSLPSKKELTTALRSFSRKETIIFTGFLAALILSTAGILQSINKYFLVSVPIQGGSVAEGIVGTPRFINPLLAFSDADRDVAALVYSGLMRKNSDGSLSPDLADKYIVSEDGLTYTFTLKDNIYFHDGRPVTVEDILYTIGQAQDPVIKSPRHVNWAGILVEKIDDRTVSFKLREKYASFLENSTLGILPAHIWQNSSSPFELNEANTGPIGSGPYRVEEIGREDSGVINSYELKAFNKFPAGRPNIKTIALRFYKNETDLLEALARGEVSQLGSITPGNAEKLLEQGYRVESTLLPRVFGLFFNQNENQLFLDKAVLRAIDQAIDKERVVNDVLVGFGTPIDGPVPQNIFADKTTAPASTLTREERLVQIQNDLGKAGWRLGEDGYFQKTVTENGKQVTKVLQFSISTGNAPELARSAAIISENLNEAGMKVDVRTFESGNLNQSVIRPRKYEALFFGQIIQNDTDLYAFWHSSQRLDPGLNVSLYTSTKVDKILEDMFVTRTESERAKKFQEFEAEIEKDMPAVFVYSPSFIYIVDSRIKGLTMENITSPSGRFANAHLWYISTDNIWRIFSRRQ
jgi:peptide/nickel transport system substrate-binding protein